MRDFEFYVTDDRYVVRSLLVVTMIDASDALAAAERLVGEPHHLAVEVWERGERLFSLNATDPSKA
jgi:hypothetical protein